MTVSVWILIIYMGNGAGGGPLVVDNIASEKDCNWLSTQIDIWTPRADNFRCFRVVKTMPQPGEPK